jgi:hypothetical protein
VPFSHGRGESSQQLQRFVLSELVESVDIIGRGGELAGNISQAGGKQRGAVRPRKLKRSTGADVPDVVYDQQRPPLE